MLSVLEPQVFQDPSTSRTQHFNLEIVNAPSHVKDSSVTAERAKRSHVIKMLPTMILPRKESFKF